MKTFALTHCVNDNFIFSRYHIHNEKERNLLIRSNEFIDYLGMISGRVNTIASGFIVASDKHYPYENFIIKESGSSALIEIEYQNRISANRKAIFVRDII